MQFDGKVALVAGGARDIGKACALALVAGGASVAIVHSGSDGQAAATLEEAAVLPGRMIAIKADLTTPEGVERAVTGTLKAFGDRIDILQFVTGGIVARRRLAEIDADFWHKVMDVNVTSLVLTAQAVAPHMSRGGAIVTFASQAGRDGGGPGAMAYATAKGAVMSLTRALAKELGPAIRVNALCPGMIATTFHDTFTQAEARTRTAQATALKREGRADEVGAFAAWLSSDAAGYVTGGCFDINGGVLFS